MAKITLKGNEINTVGELPKVGTQLNDFELVSEDLGVKKLSDYVGKKLILNIVPSIDTGVCGASARRFNEEAAKLTDTVVINISMDLPFALGRYCASEGLKAIQTLSAFRSSFGADFGVTIADLPLKGCLSRAVIVTDVAKKIVYTEQVPEIVQEPDYQAALDAL